MSLIIKKASTIPVKIDIDITTDAGRIQGHFTGHAKVRSQPEMKAFAARLNELSKENPDDGEDTLIRDMYTSFEGLANESGPLEGDAAFNEVLAGPLSAHLTRAAMEKYWESLSTSRAGNSPRRPGR